MRLYVTVNAIFALKTAAAYRTRETVVLRVRDHVTLQKRLFHELGRALFALDWPATETRKQWFSGRMHWREKEWLGLRQNFRTIAKMNNNRPINAL